MLLRFHELMQPTLKVEDLASVDLIADVSTEDLQYDPAIDLCEQILARPLFCHRSIRKASRMKALCTQTD